MRRKSNFLPDSLISLEERIVLSTVTLLPRYAQAAALHGAAVAGQSAVNVNVNAASSNTLVRAQSVSLGQTRALGSIRRTPVVAVATDSAVTAANNHNTKNDKNDGTHHRPVRVQTGAQIVARVNNAFTSFFNTYVDVSNRYVANKDAAAFRTNVNAAITDLGIQIEAVLSTSPRASNSLIPTIQSQIGPVTNASVNSLRGRLLATTGPVEKLIANTVNIQTYTSESVTIVNQVQSEVVSEVRQFIRTPNKTFTPIT